MSVWVFGYGSLIWRPGFEYEKSMVGQVKDFERVFYQGNDKHRGTPQRLGRVATLLEKQGSDVWGRAFLLPNDSSTTQSLDYLNTRENREGGYTTLMVNFYPRAAHHQPILVLVYVALPNNPMYLGPKPYPEMAREVVSSEGECGTNIEYVLNIAEFMRDEVPGVDDEHLFMLEMHIITSLEQPPPEEGAHSFQSTLESSSPPCLSEAMVWFGEDDSDCHSHSSSGFHDDLDKAGASGSRNPTREGDSDFASHVTARKLRCMHL